MTLILPPSGADPNCTSLFPTLVRSVSCSEHPGEEVENRKLARPSEFSVSQSPTTACADRGSGQTSVNRNVPSVIPTAAEGGMERLSSTT